MSLCQVIREDTYESCLEDIAENYSRAYELDSAIDWALSRIEDNEEEFINIRDDYYLWVMEELPVEDIPRVRIMFEYEKETDKVFLISIDEFNRDG